VPCARRRHDVTTLCDQRQCWRRLTSCRVIVHSVLRLRRWRDFAWPSSALTPSRRSSRPSTAQQRPLPVEVVRDLLGIARAMYAAFEKPGPAHVANRSAWLIATCRRRRSSPRRASAWPANAVALAMERWCGQRVVLLERPKGGKACSASWGGRDEAAGSAAVGPVARLGPREADADPATHAQPSPAVGLSWTTPEKVFRKVRRPVRRFRCRSQRCATGAAQT
jgi:hypothetical protein